MNLFEKIAEERNNITPANIGFGAATLGGLGLTGHSIYKTHKNNNKIEELKDKKEGALKDSRYYEKTLDQLKAAKDDFIAEKTKEYSQSMPLDQAKENAKGAYDMEINMRKQSGRKKLNEFVDFAREQENLKDDIKKLSRNKKIGLALSGIGAAGLGYDIYHNPFKKTPFSQTGMNWKRYCWFFEYLL